MQFGTSSAVQWLRLYSSNAGEVGSIPDQGTRYHMPCHIGQKKKNHIIYPTGNKGMRGSGWRFTTQSWTLTEAWSCLNLHCWSIWPGPFSSPGLGFHSGKVRSVWSISDVLYVIWRKVVIWLQMLSCSSLDCMNNSQPTSSTSSSQGGLYLEFLCGPILKPDCCDSSQLLMTFWRGKEKETQGCLSEMKRGRRNKTVLGSYRNRPKTQWVVAHVCMWYTLNKRLRLQIQRKSFMSPSDTMTQNLYPPFPVLEAIFINKWSCVSNTFCKLRALGILTSSLQSLQKVGSYYLHFTVRILRFERFGNVTKDPQLVSGSWKSK